MKYFLMVGSAKVDQSDKVKSLISDIFDMAHAHRVRDNGLRDFNYKNSLSDIHRDLYTIATILSTLETGRVIRLLLVLKSVLNNVSFSDLQSGS